MVKPCIPSYKPIDIEPVTEGITIMHQYTITMTAKVEADNAEEAALLAYQELTNGNAAIEFSVIDEAGKATPISLDRTKAEEFAAEDHTADPGNW